MGFTLTTIQHTMRGLQNSSILRLINTQMFLQVKEYSRWAHRRPSKIVNEKEIFGDTNENSASNNILKDAKFAFARRQKLLAKETAKEKPKPEDRFGNGTLNDDGSPVFVKLQKDDPMISSLMLTVKSRKKQKQDNRILLEGYRLIEDAMKAGLVPEIVIFSRKPDLQRLPLPKTGVKLYKIPYQTIQLWSDLTTSPGVMGIFKTPDISRKEPADNALPVTIICDNVREPGNLGSVLRVAAGVGCERVILTKGCVDLWSPKVLRAAAGAHFRLPIFISQTWPEVQYLISEDANIFVADNNIKPPVEPSEDVASDSSSSSSSDSESSDSDAESKDEADNVVEKIRDDFGEGSSKDPATSGSEKHVKSYDAIKRKRALYEDAENLPIVPYFAARYTNNESIVIVGGETEGLSPESLSLALRRDGVRVNVPLTNGVDSLNTGTALGVVLFEIKRQFISRLNNL